MKLGILFLCLLCIFPTLNGKLEDGWNGLKVFESTRKEVIQAFGKPIYDEDGFPRFETTDASVLVLFANDPCTNIDSITGGFKVAKGTIVQYQVVLKNSLPLDKLSWNPDRYERVRESHNRNFLQYYDAQDGVRLMTELMEDGKLEKVGVIYFERTPEKEKKFACAK